MFPVIWVSSSGDIDQDELASSKLLFFQIGLDRFIEPHQQIGQN